jgi:alpha-L-fucosidase 2
LAAAALVLCCALASLEEARSQDLPIHGSDFELWYDAPAARWIEALPVGNGRMGAMVFGGVEHARYQFNEDTLWAGGPRSYAHAGAAEHLPTIRQLLLAGNQPEAERLAARHFMSIPLRQMPYQPMGDVELDFPDHGEAHD